MDCRIPWLRASGHTRKSKAASEVSLGLYSMLLTRW
jgi:hypothetical protein